MMPDNQNTPQQGGRTGKRKRTVSITWLIIGTVAVLLLGAYAIAAFRASSRIREIEWLAGLPAADPASPSGLPARYAGRIFGPADRRTPLGQEASAYWWTVTSSDGEAGEDVKCLKRVRSGLVLATPAGVMPVAWSGADPDDISLASDSDSGEYGRPLAIDIGGAPSMKYERVPGGICEYGEKYYQTFIGQGVRAEVVGCFRNGALGRCDSVLGGVISVPDIKSDMRHRFGSAMHMFFYPMYLGLCLLFLATVALWKIVIHDTSRRPAELGGEGTR